MKTIYPYMIDQNSICKNIINIRMFIEKHTDFFNFVWEPNIILV